MSGIIDRVRGYFRTPKLDELVLDIKMYNNDIKRVQKANEKQSIEMREKAKQERVFLIDLKILFPSIFV